MNLIGEIRSFGLFAGLLGLPEMPLMHDAMHPCPPLSVTCAVKQPCECFSLRYASHVKCDLDAMNCVVEHLSFDDPDDMEGFLHTFRFDSVVALH